MVIDYILYAITQNTSFVYRLPGLQYVKAGLQLSETVHSRRCFTSYVPHLMNEQELSSLLQSLLTIVTWFWSNCITVSCLLKDFNILTVLCPYFLFFRFLLCGKFIRGHNVPNFITTGWVLYNMWQHILMFLCSYCKHL